MQTRGLRLLFCLILLGLSIISICQAAGERWVQVAPMREARRGVGVAELNGKIYVIAGTRAGDQRINWVEVYDPTTNTWGHAAPVPAFLDHMAVAAARKKLYAIGGLPASNKTYEYSPEDDSWTERSDMPTLRGASAAVTINDKIYVIGGLGLDGVVGDTEVYDPATDQWTRLLSMPTARSHLAASVINGRIYAVGGRDGDSVTITALEAYDPISDGWIRKSSMPTGRSGIAAAAVNNLLYVFGGEGNPNTPFKQTEIYDPSTDSWQSGIPMATPRYNTGAAVIDNRVYIPGGSTAQEPHITDINEAFLTDARENYFPHFVAGQGITSEITLANFSSTQLALGTVEILDQQGAPLQLNVDGTRRNRFPVSIPPLGSVTFKAEDQSPVIRVGWVVVSTDVELSGTVLFATTTGAAGVGVGRPYNRFIAPIQQKPAAGTRTGLAVANTMDHEVTVDLSLRTERGNEVATFALTLPARGQSARFLDEIFTDVDINDFRGTLTAQVEDEDQVSAVALLVTGNKLTTLPIAGQ